MKCSHNYLKSSFGLYISTLFTLLHRGVEVSKSSRPRILAVLWCNQYHKIAQYLLQEFDTIFQLPEVLRALQLLDSGRRARAAEKRLVRLNNDGCKKKKKLGVLKSIIKESKNEPSPGSGTVSGSLAVRIRKWIATIPAAKLAYFALSLPRDNWKELADIIHSAPSDFSLPWFQNYIFTGQFPPDSVLAVKDALKTDGSNLETILQTYANNQIPYTFVRTHCGVNNISADAKAAMAAYTPLDTLIWYHEEIATPVVNQIIKQRLQQGNEKVKLGYGKLMERLLYFQRTNQMDFFDLLIPFADERLRAIKLDMEAPVVVIGDASYSMDVAIRTSTIIASVLTLLTDAELKFFHTEAFNSPKAVASVSDVLQVAEQVKGTSSNRLGYRVIHATDLIDGCVFGYSRIQRIS
jgi:hypothetical protein